MALERGTSEDERRLDKVLDNNDCELFAANDEVLPPLLFIGEDVMGATDKRDALHNRDVLVDCCPNWNDVWDGEHCCTFE